jgi:flavin-dependent dehydrogenase
LQFDAVIVGAGVAGSVAALNLAPFRRVLLVERDASPAWRIGESLPGAARRLLCDMGIWDDFAAGGHLPRHVLRSAWGAEQPAIRDALADPDGHGWQIDRVRFERSLRAEAARRGAVMIAPAKLIALERAADGWRVTIDRQGEMLHAGGRLVIDAAGRRSRWLTPYGARRRIEDRLCCAFIRAQDVALPAGVVQIEAEADGWWYAAPIPRGAGILAFHTDAGMRAGRSASLLLARARALPMLGRLAADPGWERGAHGVCAAHGACLVPAAGEAWLAAGDAALAFDPLAAQGIFNALYLGLAAAEAAARWLAGQTGALADYAAEVAGIADAYRAQRAAWYRLETRWAGRPFWASRHAREPAG